MQSTPEEKRKAFDILIRTAEGGAARAAIQNNLRELLMTAESNNLKPLKNPNKRPSLYDVTKELALEDM